MCLLLGHTSPVANRARGLIKNELKLTFRTSDQCKLVHVIFFLLLCLLFSIIYFVVMSLPSPICNMETWWRKTQMLSWLHNSSNLDTAFSFTFFQHVFDLSKDNIKKKKKSEWKSQVLVEQMKRERVFVSVCVRVYICVAENNFSSIQVEVKFWTNYFCSHMAQL